MVLSDQQIRAFLGDEIRPFDRGQVNPASYDLRLSNELKRPMWYWRPLLWRFFYPLHKANPRKWPLWSKTVIYDRYLLKPGELVLCSSLEYTCIPTDMVALLFSKSSTGRIGIEHLHAGYGDPGFCGNWTLELMNVAPWPVELIAGKRLMQLVFVRMSERARVAYDQTGRYFGQTGPTEARCKKEQ